MTHTSIMDLKKRLDTAQHGKGMKVRLRCGSCMYLHSKCPAKEAPCIQTGKSASSNSCSEYEADYSKVKLPRANAETGEVKRVSFVGVLREVGKLTKDLNEVELNLLAKAFIDATAMTRVADIKLDAQIKLGQTVYVNLSAPRVDYLNCWFKASAVSLNRKKTHVNVYAKLPDGNETRAMLVLDSDSIMTVSQFEKHAKALRKAKLVNAPSKMLQGILPFIPKEKIDYYEPQSMATVQTPVMQKFEKPKLKTTFKVDTNADGSRVVTI